jgi:hypothetical protein
MLDDLFLLPLKDFAFRFRGFVFMRLMCGKEVKMPYPFMGVQLIYGQGR